MYTGLDKISGIVDPFRDRLADMNLRVCAYYYCLNGQTEIGGGTEIGGVDPIQCPSGTVPATNVLGDLGCCSEPGTVQFKVNLNCKGTIDDSAEVYMRVDGPNVGPNDCIGYSLAYHY